MKNLTLLLISLVVFTMWVQAQVPCGCPPNKRFRRDVDPREVTRVGDMMFREKDRRRFQGKQIHEKRFRMGTNLFNSERWTKGLVTYYLQPDSSNSANDMTKYRTVIKNALNTLSTQVQAAGCNITFVDAGTTVPNSKTNYIIVQNGGDGACWSYIGRVGDDVTAARQELSLGAGCVYDNVIQHEFIHALGFYHEHQLPERDNYITINWDTVRGDYCGAFNKCNDCTSYSTYNPIGIMHYSSTAFSCNGSDTIISKANPSQKIGDTFLQSSDITGIKNFYCPSG